jgi:hypothetical protein
MSNFCSGVVYLFYAAKYIAAHQFYAASIYIHIYIYKTDISEYKTKVLPLKGWIKKILDMNIAAIDEMMVRYRRKRRK